MGKEPIRTDDEMRLQGALEAMLFVCGDPVEPQELADALGCERSDVLRSLSALNRRYREERRGIQLRWINEKPQLCSHPEYAEYIENLLQPVSKKTFSQSVIETLSIIAYKQPVTRAEIEEVRGVRCEYSIHQLQEMKLVEEVGRKKTVGRPALFATTDAFLQFFNLPNLEALPHRELFDQSAQKLMETLDV